MMDYIDTYYKNYFVGTAKILEDKDAGKYSDLTYVHDYVAHVADNDELYVAAERSAKEYPPGVQVEAQIVSFQDYGFFVEFGLSGTGLVHKSNFNGIEVTDDHEVGDWVIVEIVKFNSQHDRFELKLVDI